MKTELRPSLAIIAATTVATLTLSLATRALAQDDTVTISGAEFQRMVYSAHLLASFHEKPALEASLQVLLETQRRNPHANPTLLAEVTQAALARYRTNAPAYIRTNGTRDEILAAYVDALRQVPAHTNFVPANLSLLNSLITRAQAPAEEPQADMIHSGSQSLLGAEGDLVQRQALLDECATRAAGNRAFATALDSLLLPETSVSFADAPADIISNTSSPLHDNPTMQTLLGFSLASGDGSLTVSSNQLMTLFSGETRTFWDTIHTNLALQQEINLTRPDLLSYLTNQPALSADAERLATVKQGQSRKIAAATAAILVQSQLMEARDPLIKLPDQMLGCAEGLHKITDGLAAFAEKDATKLAKAAATGNMLGGALEVFDLFFGGESAEEEIVREIGNIKTLLGDLSTNMNYRFDRVDQSLTTIFDTLNERFDQIEITLDTQGRQIAHLNGSVDQIRLSLLDVQTDLFRIERNLATFHAEDLRDTMVGKMNVGLGYEASAGKPMAYDLYNPNFVVMATDFYTYAHDTADGEALSRYTTLPFGDQHFFSQLSPAGATNVYAETLNYIKKCLRQRLSLGTAFPEAPILVNPQDWNAGAGAFLQLALENPGYFRQYDRTKGFPEHLDNIISKGRDLTNFFRSLVFTGIGTNLNWPLYDALEDFYVGKLTNFNGQVRSLEQQYATDHGIPTLESWRQWGMVVPRVSVASTTLLKAGAGAAPVPAGLTNVLAVDGGATHILALQADGTVIAWSRSLAPYEDYGQARVPAGLSNVVAIAAGEFHNLALRSNGTVVAWGTGQWNYGQTNVPSGLSNVVAITAGAESSAALKSDGTIVSWGRAGLGTPADVTNAVAISAGGYYFNLALTADGRVRAWGDNYYGQCNVPAQATNVVAISAGNIHSLALRADGTVVAWGRNDSGCTNVPTDLSNVVAIAAGPGFSMALKADGTVRVWGSNYGGPCNVPPEATNIVVIGAGYLSSLYVKCMPSGNTNASPTLSLVRGATPIRVRDQLWAVNDLVRTNLDLGLRAAAIELSGSKALYQAVLELAMPYTIERDDVLHGFLYGSEALADLEGSRRFLEAENTKRQGMAEAMPQELPATASLRYLRFRERLAARLNDLAATGQPEIPRLVSQTLRLLNLLRDAWSSTPPPALELWSEVNSPRLLLHGEPYARYTLQWSDSLSAPGWNPTTTTNWHNEQIIIPPVSSGAQRFYRGMLPSP